MVLTQNKFRVKVTIMRLMTHWPTVTVEKISLFRVSTLKILGVSMITIFSNISCHSQQGEATKQKSDGQKESKTMNSTPVEIARVRRGSISEKLNSAAVVRAKERASVRSLVSGLVVELFVEEGDRVKAKQKLAKLSRPGANSLIQKARSAYQKSRRDVKRLSSLVQRGLAPREELTQAKFSRDQSRLELSRLREESKNETLRSPINGVITKRAVYRGEAVSPGQLIFDVMDLTKIYVPLKIPDRWATRVRVGMKAALFDRSGQPLSINAGLSYVSPVIDAETGTITVWVSPDISPQSARSKAQEQAELTPLKPGLFVSAEITLDEKSDALLIPRDAIVFKDGQATVTRVVGEYGRHTVVKLGYQESDFVEIISPLREGDAVVTFGQRGLEDGGLVRVIDPPQTNQSDSAPEFSGSLKR